MPQPSTLSRILRAHIDRLRISFASLAMWQSPNVSCKQISYLAHTGSLFYLRKSDVRACKKKRGGKTDLVLRLKSDVFQMSKKVRDWNRNVWAVESTRVPNTYCVVEWVNIFFSDMWRSIPGRWSSKFKVGWPVHSRSSPSQGESRSMLIIVRLPFLKHEFTNCHTVFFAFSGLRCVEPKLLAGPWQHHLVWALFHRLGFISLLRAVTQPTAQEKSRMVTGS